MKVTTFLKHNAITLFLSSLAINIIIILCICTFFYFKLHALDSHIFLSLVALNILFATLFAANGIFFENPVQIFAYFTISILVVIRSWIGWAHTEFTTINYSYSHIMLFALLSSSLIVVTQLIFYLFGFLLPEMSFFNLFHNSQYDASRSTLDPEPRIILHYQIFTTSLPFDLQCIASWSLINLLTEGARFQGYSLMLVCSTTLWAAFGWLAVRIQRRWMMLFFMATSLFAPIIILFIHLSLSSSSSPLVHTLFLAAAVFGIARLLLIYWSIKLYQDFDVDIQVPLQLELYSGQLRQKRKELVDDDHYESNYFYDDGL